MWLPIQNVAQFLCPLVHAQTVTVTLLPVSTVQGQAATLTCTFSLDGPGALFNVVWRQRGTLIADFYNGAQTPTYGTGFSEPDYVASRNDSMSTLTIAMFPSSITLSDLTGSYPSTGGTAYLIEGVDRRFTCEVPDINPAASFTWSVDGGVITPDNTVNVTGDDKLTTSTSLATVSPAWNSHGEMLQCQASNKDGHDGISISVTLDIKVPPKTSSMSMYDSNGAFAPGGSVSVDQDASHTFTCQTQSRPAATIQWDVGSPSYQQSIIGPTNPGPGNGLVDTTRTWTFTSNRTNHRQDVKCMANTSESQQPYPAVMVTLNVNGPPDMPVISGNAGSTSMTENDSIVLTCTADMGYPDDWTLVWSNGGSPGPSTSSSASGDRYSFTSTLDYTPRRQDNGNTITCTANRAPWIPGPVGSLGPIDVKFCARSRSVTQIPPQATAGSSVSLRCATSESSNPATSLIWSKDNVNLVPTNQSNTTGDYGGRLTSVSYTIFLNKTNNGEVYNCCATNPTIASCATPLCEMHTLNVRYPPDFILLNQTPQSPVTEGSDDVTLTCTVDANPSTVEITWKRNEQVDALKTTSGVTSTLSLRNIRREDAGYYTCTANNGVPTDNPTDVVSSPITVIVHYEVNITNKAMNEVGVKDGDTAVLTCVAVGNPQPVMEWYGPNTTGIISDTDEGKFLITNETSGGDGVFEFKVTSKLTVKAVDSQVDYGVYTCISSNAIGREDSLNITLTGTRRPDKPTRVEITERTAESLTVTWTPGYDGGETQSFRVSYIKTSDSTEVFTEETGGKTTSTAIGLDDYTEYEIRVYAKNSIGESIGYGNTMGYTLPAAPSPDSGITVEFNKDEDTVKVEGLKEGNGCIQLEVRYQGNDTWQECGDCIESDQTVTLSEWCASSQKRRRRAVGDIEAVRSRHCIGGLCSQPAEADEATPPDPTSSGPDVGLIVGATVGGVVLVAIIVVLVVYLVRTSPKKRSGKEDSFSRANDIQDVELQEQSHDAQPEENNGITNEALQNNESDDGYMHMENKRKVAYPVPPKRETSLPQKTVEDEIMKSAAPKTAGDEPTNKVQDEMVKSSPSKTTGDEATNKGDSKPPVTRPKPKAVKKYQAPSKTEVDEEIPKKKPEKNEEPDAEPTEEDGLEADTKGLIPVKRYTVDSGDTYAQVNKTKLPPKPQSARSAPTNLPDVTYAEVNRDKKPKPPPDDYAAKKKPKKYVPPSSRAAEESAYEEVQISDKDKAKIPPAAASADTYASVGGQQDTSGRVVTEDGLIYAEVGHMKQHPVDQPPIQTEESTEYASLDFTRMKPEDK
ncbi:Down syndrome cell adhesion molecule-like protein 1 homolog [Patiria miniata]|uniref:Nephrin n=1 Tax=Patiria miniata TaxID=46514 RepID=A0A914AMX5_PATMI|nr:Down syndrome cell adhesion molecule-like protein 1 homolog [Patiria miniata]